MPYDKRISKSARKQIKVARKWVKRQESSNAAESSKYLAAVKRVPKAK